MADIHLTYGPGATVTVLKTSLKSLGLKAKLAIRIEETEGELRDALHLHLGPGLGADGARRLPKTLALCHRIFEKRTVRLTADLGTESIELLFPPGQTSLQYRERIGELCAAVAGYHESTR